MRVTALVRTRNTKRDLSNLISDLRRQEGVDLSILVVDNCSEDGTLELARELADTVIQISDQEWSWGRALNMGVANVPDEDDFVLVVSSDVRMPETRCVAELADSFHGHPFLGAVYPRQVPRKNAPLLEIGRIQRQFPARQTRFQVNKDLKKFDSTGAAVSIVMSNSCGLYRLKALREIPFREKIPAEEGPWGQEATANGWHFYYNGSISVAHSHTESTRRHVIRYFQFEEEDRRRKDSSHWPPHLLWGVKFLASETRTRMKTARHLKDVPWQTKFSALVDLFPIAVWVAIVLIGLRCGFELSHLRKRFW